MARSITNEQPRKSAEPNKPKSRGARETPYCLSSRESEVMEWVARGKSASEIGSILKIAKRTVDAHVCSAVRNIGTANRTHAVAIAVRDHLFIV